MMNPYVLAVPERVISGAGCISKLPELLKELEKKKVALFADMGARCHDRDPQGLL